MKGMQGSCDAAWSGQANNSVSSEPFDPFDFAQGKQTQGAWRGERLAARKARRKAKARKAEDRRQTTDDRRQM
ncbi:MAG: hypothetical protein LJE88_14665, partial [Deltaproteobacteria bacterium]|nr:hypothetical protein [Deltaproteobacteria bacterium]